MNFIGKYHIVHLCDERADRVYIEVYIDYRVISAVMAHPGLAVNMKSRGTGFKSCLGWMLVIMGVLNYTMRQTVQMCVM